MFWPLVLYEVHLVFSTWSLYADSFPSRCHITRSIHFRLESISMKKYKEHENLVESPYKHMFMINAMVPTCPTIISIRDYCVIAEFNYVNIQRLVLHQ
jgi:hypothetical protein